LSARASTCTRFRRASLSVPVSRLICLVSRRRFGTSSRGCGRLSLQAMEAWTTQAAGEGSDASESLGASGVGKWCLPMVFGNRFSQHLTARTRLLFGSNTFSARFCSLTDLTFVRRVQRSYFPLLSYSLLGQCSEADASFRRGTHS